MKYLIKNYCVSCRSKIENSIKHYIEYGNFCLDCILRTANASGINANMVEHNGIKPPPKKKKATSECSVPLTEKALDEVYDLRGAGITFAKIASMLGYRHATTARKRFLIAERTRDY